MPFTRTSIELKYKGVDGWHVFTSTDLPGLYVASREAKKAFSDLSQAIQMLLKLDENLDVEAFPEAELRSFIDSVKAHADTSGDELVMSDKRFALAA